MDFKINGILFWEPTNQKDDLDKELPQDLVGLIIIVVSIPDFKAKKVIFELCATSGN